jgi:hypothetical protein
LWAITVNLFEARFWTGTGNVSWQTAQELLGCRKCSSSDTLYCEDAA